MFEAFSFNHLESEIYMWFWCCFDYFPMDMHECLQETNPDGEKCKRQEKKCVPDREQFVKSGHTTTCLVTVVRDIEQRITHSALCFTMHPYWKMCVHSCGHVISRVSDHTGISQLYNMLEIWHAGPEPSICDRIILIL